MKARTALLPIVFFPVLNLVDLRLRESQLLSAFRGQQWLFQIAVLDYRPYYYLLAIVLLEDELILVLCKKIIILRSPYFRG